MRRDPRLTRRTALRTGVTATGLLGLGTRAATARAGVPPPDDPGSDGDRYYQVDFAAGEPIEVLGERSDSFYGRQNRLVGYVHTDSERSDDEVVERDTWINSLDPETRACISDERITAERLSGGLALVRFTVADGCELTLSLAAYPLPGGEFSFDAEQRLVAAGTGTFGPGRHALYVTLPDGPEVVEPVARGQVSFGSSVALDGPTLVVGERGSGSYRGSAYVLAETDDGWARSRRFVGSTTGGGFGTDVAVDGDDLLVSAPGEGGQQGRDAGAVHAFERGSGPDVWTRRQRIVPEDGAEASGDFGFAVDLDGSTALVANPGSGGTGEVYLYESGGDGWERTATLLSDDAERSAGFGMSGAVSGDTAVVGAYLEGESAGAAYVFDRASGWERARRLRPAGLDPGDWFGATVAVDGDRVVVGAPSDDDEAEAAGAAYAFERSDGAWERTAKLTPDDADRSEFAFFAHRRGLALRGDRVLAGAFADYVGGVRSGPRWGSAYLFERRGGAWTQRTQFVPSEGNRFGWAVSLDDRRGAVGAAFEQSNGDVYVVDR